MENKIKQNEYGQFRKAQQNEEITALSEMFDCVCYLCFYDKKSLDIEATLESIKKEPCLNCESRLENDEFYINDIGAKI